MEVKAYDVIVVGGGPAGSACSAFLGMKGLSVLLLDKAKFPRDKTCGDAISGKSVRVLQRLGLFEQLSSSAQARIGGILVSDPKGEIADILITEGRYGEKTYGFCAKRLEFDDILFQNAKKHAEVIEQFQVTDVIFESGYAVGVRGLDSAKQQREFRAKMVVGADGATSVVAQKVGAYDSDPEHWCVAVRGYYKGVKDMKEEIEIHFIDEVIPGYFWIFPIKGGEANVGLGMLTSDVQKRKLNLKQLMLDVIEKNAYFKKRFEGSQMVGDIKGWNLPLGSKRRKAAGNGWVLLGDAAQLIDPFSGEGIGNGLTSAMLASDVIEVAVKSGDVSESRLSDYDRQLWAALGRELHTSYKMQQLGKHKWLLNAIIGKAAKSENVRKTVAKMLVNEAERKKLTSLPYLASMWMS